MVVGGYWVGAQIQYNYDFINVWEHCIQEALSSFV